MWGWTRENYHYPLNQIKLRQNTVLLILGRVHINKETSDNKNYEINDE